MDRDLPLVAAGAAMWKLVERHTGHVGYKGGIKADGLRSAHPVIDCSGWVALLLAAGMRAVNIATGHEVFSDGDVSGINTRSDRIIQVLESRSGAILEGDRITLNTLPRYATIGLQQGGGPWANQPRSRGITHVVQVVRRPADGAPFVSEAQGWAEPRGLRLMPLSDWLCLTQSFLKRGSAWAVDSYMKR